MISRVFSANTARRSVSACLRRPSHRPVHHYGAAIRQGTAALESTEGVETASTSTCVPAYQASLFEGPASRARFLSNPSACLGTAMSYSSSASSDNEVRTDASDSDNSRGVTDPFLVRHPPVDDRGVHSVLESGGKRAFAVVSLSGSQFKVTVDDVVTVSTNVEADVGERFQLDQVLLVGSADETVVGRPIVPGARVTMAVEEKKKEKKVIVFKKRRRKGYQRKNGYRRQVTALRVVDISY